MSTDKMEKVIYRGIDISCSWEYQQDMRQIHKIETIRMLRECVDMFIDHGITSKVLHSVALYAPDMFLEWEIHGDKLITKITPL